MSIEKFLKYDTNEGSDDFWLQLEMLSCLYYRLILKTKHKENFSYEFGEALDKIGIPLYNFIWRNWVETKRNMNYLKENKKDEIKIIKMLSEN